MSDDVARMILIAVSMLVGSILGATLVFLQQ